MRCLRATLLLLWFVSAAPAFGSFAIRAADGIHAGGETRFYRVVSDTIQEMRCLSSALIAPENCNVSPKSWSLSDFREHLWKMLWFRLREARGAREVLERQLKDVALLPSGPACSSTPA